MTPKSGTKPKRIPEFERNIAQMESNEALRFLDSVRARFAHGKMSPKKLADLLGDYASEPPSPSLSLPDDLMGVVASKLKPTDIASLMATSKDLKRQTEQVHRANAKASPLLYLPPKVLSNVLSNVKMADMAELKRTSRFAREQVDNALFKHNPCISNLARAILTLANWVHKKKAGKVSIGLPNQSKRIIFPVVTNDAGIYRDRIQFELSYDEFFYIDLPAKLDDATVRSFVAYLQATESEKTHPFRGTTTFELVVSANNKRRYNWTFGRPLEIPVSISENANSDYVKIITAYAKAINKYYHPEAPAIVSPSSPTPP
jgi:hypothetical protein